MDSVGWGSTKHVVSIILGVGPVEDVKLVWKSFTTWTFEGQQDKEKRRADAQLEHGLFDPTAGLMR